MKKQLVILLFMMPLLGFSQSEKSNANSSTQDFAKIGIYSDYLKAQAFTHLYSMCPQEGECNEKLRDYLTALAQEYSIHIILLCRISPYHYWAPLVNNGSYKSEIGKSGDPLLTLSLNLNRGNKIRKQGYEYTIQLLPIVTAELLDKGIISEKNLMSAIAYCNDSVPTMKITGLKVDKMNKPVMKALEYLIGNVPMEEEKGKQNSNNILPWMTYCIAEAKTMQGINECTNPLYAKGLTYHKEGGHCSLCPCGNDKHSNYCDPNAWCASFANWCLRQSKTLYTKSPRSQSFLESGNFVKIPNPVFGAIAVFTNLDENGNFKTTGHVTFVVGKIGTDKILCLGGNQGNTIKVSEYSLVQDREKRKNKSFFRGYYLPKEYIDKTKNYNTIVEDYDDATSANQEILNIKLNQSTNESTR